VEAESFLLFTGTRVCSHLDVSKGGPVKGTTTLELPRGAGSAGLARQIVTAHGSSLAGEQLKNANVMVSELVSNAFRHGQGRIALTVESSSDGMWASVEDEGSGVIATPDPRPERGGWGLYFVESLADSWGVADDASRVWFRIATAG
jgi:anti-sigma regulatory factor (Ser/Thr protein kinase)